MMKDWLRKHPDVRTIRVAAADLNGQARGKRVPARFADNVVKNGTRFPFSVLNLDIWGEDVDDSPLVFEQGDQDGILKPTERGFMPMPWLEAPTALLPIWMFRENGTPYEGDPRHALRAVVERFKARGLTPVCAMELEFFLIDDSGKTLQVPPSPRSGKRRKAALMVAVPVADHQIVDLLQAGLLGRRMNSLSVPVGADGVDVRLVDVEQGHLAAALGQQAAEDGRQVHEAGVQAEHDGGVPAHPGQRGPRLRREYLHGAAGGEQREQLEDAHGQVVPESALAWVSALS